MQKNPESKDIILSAKDIFSEYGFKKTTLDDIAKKLNIVKSALYHYYESKEGIFCKVIEYEIDIFFDRIKIEIDKSKTIKGKLLNFCLGINSNFQELINLYNITADDIYSNYDNILEIRDNFYKKNIELIESIFNGDPKLRKKKDLKTIARIYTFCVRGIIRNSAIENKPRRLKRELELFNEIYMKGVQG